jgi:hypothetical protein
MARRRLTPVAAEAQPVSPVMVVRAVAAFDDALTRRGYRPGDVVPWDQQRAEHYAARGLVVIEWHTPA